MATSTFPALQIQPPPQQDLLGQYARLVQMKTLMQQQAYQQQMQPLQLQAEQQQVAIQQQQVKAIQAGQAAFNAWDGKDYGSLAKLFVQNGGSISGANQIAMYGLDQHAKLADIALKEGEAGKNKIESIAKNHDMAAGAINAITSLPDAELSQQTLDTANRGLQEGWLDQTMGQHLQQVAQMTPTQIRTALPNISKQFMAESQAAEDALKYAQAAFMQAQTPGAQAKSITERAAAADFQTYQLTHPGSTYTDYLAYRGQAEAAGTEAGRLPGEMALAAYNKQAAMGNLLAEKGLNTVTDLFTNPQHGYSQTLSQLSATKNAVASAQNGDQLAASLAPLMTALGVTSFAGLHRINQNEINAAGPQVGSIFRQMNAALDKAGAGKLAPGTAAEMNNLMDSLLTARYSTVLQSARMAAQNAGINPAQVTVMDKQGNLIRMSEAPQPGAAAPAAGGHTIRIGNKFYQYNGSGDTSDIKNYTEIPNAQR